jgi:branched-chain amino acid transport system ATP-binding protein
MLEVDQLQARYGNSPVLHGIGFEVRPGEIVTLLGRNGSGRSTALKAVMGQVAASGSVRFKGRELLGLPSFEIARAGIGYVPESRDIFPTLTVEQNLRLGCRPGAHGPRWSFDDSYRRFPQLLERRRLGAGLLSGGEQQMLALCRTLMGSPELILVDEPAEGLAPHVIGQLAALLIELQQRGVAVLLVEQKLSLALEVSQRCLVMGRGRIVFDGGPDALRQRSEVRQEWLEV